ncbi:carbohydrate ABC transporter permease [Mollicutes bacterium LVI A0039]|nr:carbohydrate ABC transporter permease [Mollicutes bacterium LVI A0039]
MVKKKSLFTIVIQYITMICAALFALLPIVTVLFNSFKTKVELYETMPFTPPASFLNFYNFKYAWEAGDFVHAFLNTIIILVVSLFFSINFAAMIGYVLHRFDFRGKKLIKNMFALTVFIPVVTTQVIVFQMIYALGLYNTIFAPLLLYVGVDIIAIYTMLQTYDAIPKSIDESGMMDGANYYTIYFKLIYPLLKPAIASLIIIKGIAIYNDFYIPNLYLQGEAKTVATALYQFTGSLSAPQEVVSAAVIIVMIPTIVLFLLLQNYFYSGFTAGSVK